MKSKNVQSSFSKKHPDVTDSRSTKTELDYYENYPHLVPPFGFTAAFPHQYSAPFPPYPLLTPFGPALPNYPSNFLYNKLPIVPINPILLDPSFFATKDGKYLIIKKNILLYRIYRLIKASYAAKLHKRANIHKISNLAELGSRSREKLASKSNEKVQKSVTYKLDQVNYSEANKLNQSDAPNNEINEIKLKKLPIQSILKTIQQESVIIESKEKNNTETKEKLAPDFKNLKPLTLKLDQESEHERVNKFKKKNIYLLKKN